MGNAARYQALVFRQCLSLKFGTLDFLSAKHAILSVSRSRKELRHKTPFTRHGSHPRHSPGKWPGLRYF
jgi:hypothetical protein